MPHSQPTLFRLHWLHILRTLQHRNQLEEYKGADVNCPLERRTVPRLRKNPRQEISGPRATRTATSHHRKSIQWLSHIQYPGKKRHNCRLTLRASYCTAAPKKDPQDRNYATHEQNKLGSAPGKKQDNNRHSLNVTCEKRHNSMVDRSISYIGQLRPPPPPNPPPPTLQSTTPSFHHDSKKRWTRGESNPGPLPC
jgi:hypothetical protein